MKGLFIVAVIFCIINLSHADSAAVEKFTYRGQIITLNNVSLVSQISGYVIERRVNDGDYVKKGDVICVIEKQPYMLKVDKAKNELIKAGAVFEQAEGDFKRGQSLFQMKSLNTSEMDRLAALRKSRFGEYKIAESNLALAKYELSKTEIVSPQSGYIGEIDFREGSYIKSEEDVLAVIRILDPVYINFEMGYDEYKLYKLATQDTKASTTEVYLGENSRMKVSLVYDSREVNRTTGGVLMRAKIDNPEGVITPGEFENISIQVKTQKNPKKEKKMEPFLSLNSSSDEELGNE